MGQTTSRPHAPLSHTKRKTQTNELIHKNNTTRHSPLAQQHPLGRLCSARCACSARGRNPTGAPQLPDAATASLKADSSQAATSSPSAQYMAPMCTKVHRGAQNKLKDPQAIGTCGLVHLVFSSREQATSKAGRASPPGAHGRMVPHAPLPRGLPPLNPPEGRGRFHVACIT